MPSRNFDVIVLGMGVMGLAAAARLAARGLRVCAFDQFELFHRRGSSHGETRIIRRAYPESPQYAPLLDRAYPLWKEIEEHCGRTIHVRSGFLAAGPAGGPFMQQLRDYYQRCRYPHTFLTAEEVQREFPQFHLQESLYACLDPEGGFLYVDRALRALAAEAQEHGALFCAGEKILGWSQQGGAVQVKSSGNCYQAGHLVLAGGAWSVPEAARIGLPLKIWRRVMFWHRAADRSLFAPDRTPSFVVDDSGAGIYGCPALHMPGAKLGEHNLPMEIATPEQQGIPLKEGEAEPVRSFVRRMFPALSEIPSRHEFCLYTLTPDRHFILDWHPQSSRVILAMGFSGHGFKFAPVIGEAIAGMVADGKSKLPIDFLRLGRFAAADD